MRRCTLLCVIACALVCACGPKTMQTRLRDSESNAGKADDALGRAEKALAALDADTAQSELERAQKLLSNPDAPLYPEYELMKSRLDEGLAQVPRARTERERKRISDAVTRAKNKASAASDKAHARIDVVLSSKVTEDAIKQGRQALDDLRDALADGKDLELKSPEYQAWAKEQRTWASGVEPQFKVAAAKVEFMAGPLVAANEGNEKLRAAKKAKDVEERRALYTAARDRLKECSDKGKALVAKSPAMAPEAVSSDGGLASIEGVLSDCSTGVKAADKVLKALPKPKPPPKAPKAPKAPKK